MLTPYPTCTGMSNDAFLTIFLLTDSLICKDTVKLRYWANWGLPTAHLPDRIFAL